MADEGGLRSAAKIDQKREGPMRLGDKLKTLGMIGEIGTAFVFLSLWRNRRWAYKLIREANESRAAWRRENGPFEIACLNEPVKVRVVGLCEMFEEWRMEKLEERRRWKLDPFD